MHLSTLDIEIRHDPAFRIENWPCSTQSAKETIVDMATTHWAVPLPAYYRNKTVIPPYDYRQTLAGATVYVEFAVEHTRSRSGDDFFDGFIRRIRVLERGPSSRRPSDPVVKARDEEQPQY